MFMCTFYGEKLKLQSTPALCCHSIQMWCLLLLWTACLKWLSVVYTEEVEG